MKSHFHDEEDDDDMTFSACVDSVVSSSCTAVQQSSSFQRELQYIRRVLEWIYISTVELQRSKSNTIVS